MEERRDYFYDVFGLRLLSNYRLSIPSSNPSPDPDIEFIVDERARRDTSTARLVYSSPTQDSNGISHFRLFLRDGLQVICLSAGVSFELDPPQIRCSSEVKDHPGIENGLLGAVLSYWLEKQHVLALHASAVEVDGQSIVFLSSSLSGKSTLAASFVQAGFPLKSDDILPVERAEGALLSRAGYPAMRLWPEEVMFFLGDIEGLIPVEAQGRKLRLPVGTGFFGSFSSERCPIRCIYLPQRYTPEDGDDRIGFGQISPRDALIELIRYSFVARMAEAAGMGPMRLELLIELASSVPLRRLRYPSGYHHLPAVREAILEDLERQKTRVERAF